MMFGDQPTHLFTIHYSSIRWIKNSSNYERKSSTWMKHKKSNNDVGGLNWCRTWPLVELIHETFELSKSPNLWIWKNEKNKNKKEVWEQFGLHCMGPLYPKAPSSLPNLVGLEKCSRAHINGNGAVNSSHYQWVFIPIFFVFFSFPLFFILYLLLFISTSPPPPPPLPPSPLLLLLLGL